jgi:hypothetical protein
MASCLGDVDDFDKPNSESDPWVGVTRKPSLAELIGELINETKCNNPSGRHAVGHSGGITNHPGSIDRCSSNTYWELPGRWALRRLTC